MKKKVMMILLLVIGIFFISGCEEKEDTGRNLTADEKKVLMEKVNSLYFLDFYGRSFSTSELTNQEVLHYAFHMTPDGTNFQELKNYVDENLDFNLKPENYKCFVHDNDEISSYYFLYNEDTGEYDDNLEHDAHGNGNFVTNVYNRYRSAYNTGDIFTISVYKMFSSTYPDVGVVKPLFYSTYNDAYNSKNPILNLEEHFNWETGYLEVDPQKYLDEFDTSLLVTYTYTFKLVDDDYILTNYEIKKKA